MLKIIKLLSWFVCLPVWLILSFVFIFFAAIFRYLGWLGNNPTCTEIADGIWDDVILWPWKTLKGLYDA